MINEVRQEIRAHLRAGEANPYEISEKVCAGLAGQALRPIVEELMPFLVKQVIRVDRRERRTDTGLPVYLPGVGWKRMEELTATECRNIAAAYRSLSSENLEKAEQFDAWARLIEAHGVAILGGLELFREMIATATKEGVHRAHQQGTKVGRPNVLSEEDADWIVRERDAGIEPRDIAVELNIKGLRRLNGEPWRGPDVSKFYYQRVRRQLVGS